MKIFLISLILSFFTYVHVFPQSFRHYQVENGLSYNSVICSLQDKKGFLWFGTKDGLNRFDGYMFRTFRTEPDNPKSIGSNFIHCLFEDKNQHIWVGTLNGLYRYNPLHESFDILPATKNLDVRDVLLDSNGNVWYIAGLMLCRYNAQTKKTTRFENRAHQGSTSLCMDADKNLWIASNDGFIQKYNALFNTFESYSVFNKSKHTISGWIEKLYDTGQGYFLIGTSNQGMKTFDRKSNTYKDITIDNPDQTDLYVRSFLKKDEDEFWIATESGLFIYNITTGGYKNIRHKSNDPYSLSDNAVYSLTKDKEGGVWVGTYFAGINYYANQAIIFDKFFPGGGKNDLSGHAVREICSDIHNNLWVGTEDGGLNRLFKSSGIFEHFKPGAGKNSISHTNIHGLLSSGQELWVGTFERGLDVMNINNKSIIRHYSANFGRNQLKSNFIECMLKTRSGEILIGTATGLYRYNRNRDYFDPISEVPGNLHYSCLLEDSKGTIWAGSLRSGVYFFNPRNKTSGSLTHDERNRNSISSNSINSIFVDTDNTLWITSENGLNKYDGKNRRFKRYSSSDGFPSDVFYEILEDGNRNLWISTSRGLVCFNSATEKMRTYTKASGLLSDQFNYRSAFKDQNGRMYFGNLKGMISLVPNEHTENRFFPPIYFTGFQVYNRELEINRGNSPLTRSINFTKEIELPFDQSTFSIDFAALGYTAPESTEYSYIMEGLDKHWTYLKTNRKIYFTNLSPGHYFLKIKASDGFGIWNKYLAQLKIIVKPPLWLSIYALFLYTIIILTLCYLAIRYYRKRSMEEGARKDELWESKKQKELYNSKLEFFTHVTHEIRTPLTLIKGPLEEVLKNCGELPSLQGSLTTISRNTDRLLELTDQLLDFKKTETKGFSLNFTNINITRLLEDNCLRYKLAMADRNLELNVDLPKRTIYGLVDPESLNKIFSNLIDNAVKYADSKIFITVQLHDHTFQLDIKSDGYLIPIKDQEKIFEPFYRLEMNRNQRGTGIGLSLARALAELHHGSLQLANVDQQYNLFSLIIPRCEPDIDLVTDYNHPDISDCESEQDPALKQVILLVDDNIEIREFSAARLRKNFKVLQAGNGMEAMDVIMQHSIQLIVSDVMMPVMDGYTLCQTIKNNLEYAHIPIIMLTAKSTLQSKIAGLESGADAYIEKPFSPEHLLTQINNLLSSREKIKNYFASSPLAHMKSMACNKPDEKFLDQLNKIILANISNKSLDVELLAGMMNMTRPTFYRKIKAISNLTPHELITITRLKMAAELLVSENHKMLKIASMTGFGSQAQFTRSFTKQFGMSPTEFSNMNKLK